MVTITGKGDSPRYVYFMLRLNYKRQTLQKGPSPFWRAHLHVIHIHAFGSIDAAMDSKCISISKWSLRTFDAMLIYQMRHWFYFYWYFLDASCIVHIFPGPTCHLRKQYVCTHAIQRTYWGNTTARVVCMFFYVSTWFLQIPVFFYIAVATCSIEPVHM